MVVFPYEVTQRGVACWSVDPDAHSVAHSKTVIPAERCYSGSVKDVPDGPGFQMITFNKVLEHVKDPVSLLSAAVGKLANSSAFIYVELPEGDRSFYERTFTRRSEFFIEHFMVFNVSSLLRLGALAGLEPADGFHVVTDPSGKRTIYSFFTPVS